MRIAIIGAGGLGGSLVRGLCGQFELAVSDLDEAKLEAARAMGPNVQTFLSAKDAVSGVDAVVVAVKPNGVEKLLGSLALDGAYVISCAAGVTLASLERWTPARVARAMPNIGAAVGVSTTALYCGDRCIDGDSGVLESIFRAVGEVAWMAKEPDMHTATAVAGSGPAFALVALEAMEDAAVAAGVGRAEARVLARGALQAAAALAEPDVHPADLRARVTSPGGTTAAGLAALEESGGRAAFQRAVAAAIERSREMA
jgi:pyrroline-5-carboxylate reductase